MRRLLATGILTLLMAACAQPGVLPTPEATLDVSVIQTQAVQEFVATMTAQAGEPSPTPTVTATPTPIVTATATPTSVPTTYVVQPEDTLASIARQYETTAEAICIFNALPDCSVISPGQELLIPPEGFEVTPTHTATSTPTSTALPTDTPTAMPTFTPTATFTPTPYEFMYEEGSMQTAPNCATVYLRIKVVGAGDEPVNGVTVRLQWLEFTDHKITGEAEADGEVGFSPLGPEHYYAPIDFHIQLVQSPTDPTPRSNEKIVHFTDCGTAGQFTNMRFVYRR